MRGRSRWSEKEVVGRARDQERERGWGVRLMRIRGRRREDHRGRGFVMLNCLS